MKTTFQRKAGLGFVVLALALIFFLVVVKADIDSQQAFLCEIIDANPNLSMEKCPAHNNSSSWLLTGSFGIAFSILGGGLYLFLNSQVVNTVNNQVIDAAKLDAEEIKVVELLEAAKGSVYQSDIMKFADWSKVKVTRVLDRLEAKEIIERKRRGMTNLVVLR